MRLIKSLSCFTFSSIKVPIVDVKNFLTQTDYIKDCKNVAQSLHKYGCLIIKDPRVDAQQNNKFLDQMEKYFHTRAQVYYQNKTVSDIFPEYDFQVGATPQFSERARNHEQILKGYKNENQAQTPTPVPHDAKWRYFWNIGDVMADIAQNQPPKDFPEFKECMDAWGRHMLNGCLTVAQMAAIGLGLDRTIFSEMLQRGPHKLAPTGSDLQKYPVGTIFAGFHYDFNFLTIHGKSRYPGLYAWLRTGEKFNVSVPEGHLLLQAGKQFEWLTGGYINCGFHQVVYTKEAAQLKEKAEKEGRIPWRISSTLFSHIRGDVTLKPLPKFQNAESIKKYHKISAQEHADQELKAIMLKH